MAVLERLSDAETKKYAGRWVAIRGGTVLYAADSPKEVAEWLTKNHEAADLVYRVPTHGDPLNFF